jgi:hypothetical protein
MFESLSRYSGLIDSPEEFHRSNRSYLDSLIHADEQFVCAISATDGRWARWRMRKSTKLVLTTDRLIMFKRGLLRKQSEDYALDSITSVQYSSGLGGGVIRVQGAHIDDRYRALSNTGQQFVTELRRVMGED